MHQEIPIKLILRDSPKTNDLMSPPKENLLLNFKVGLSKQSGYHASWRDSYYERFALVYGRLMG